MKTRKTTTLKTAECLTKNDFLAKYIGNSTTDDFENICNKFIHLINGKTDGETQNVYMRYFFGIIHHMCTVNPQLKTHKQNGNEPVIFEVILERMKFFVENYKFIWAYLFLKEYSSSARDSVIFLCNDYDYYNDKYWGELYEKHVL